MFSRKFHLNFKHIQTFFLQKKMSACLDNVIVLVAGVEFAVEGEFRDIAASFPRKVRAVLLAVQV